MLEIIPGFGKGFAKVAETVFKTRSSLQDDIRKSTKEVLNVSIEDSDPYIIRVNSNAEAKKISSSINDFCAPHIQGWWLDTQDKLVREGTQIREALVLKIQEDIQQISNGISKHLGQSLQVDLNINKIQFPKFDFQGIDARVKHQQEVITRTRKEEETKSRCCKSDEVYYVDVEYEDKLEFYEINLRQTVNQIKQKIDEQASRNQHLLERVIEDQISKDFRNAEQQINDYIKRFKNEFDCLLKEREAKQTEADKISETLNLQKDILSKYLYELNDIMASLKQWKPN